MSDAQEKRKAGLPTRVRMRHETHFVEQLESRHGEPVGKRVPIDSLEPDPNQPRSVMGEMDDLVQSIGDRGILEPILVRRNPESSGDGDEESRPPFRIVSGERRYQAALRAGLVEVPVIELDVDDGEALEIALIENLQRKDLTPFEEAEGYRALMERLGLTQAEVGRRVGRARTVVTEALALLSIPPRVRDAIQALDISSKTILREIAKLDDEAAMIAAIEQVAEQGLSRDDLREMGREQRRSGDVRGRSSGMSSRKPHVFRFKAPDKRYSVALSFSSSTVDRTDLIDALEEILAELRNAAQSGA
ncbi:MAG: ParB/RepB/Spo0J family partition protein [Thermoanaerobaculia bacterium]